MSNPNKQYTLKPQLLQVQSLNPFAAYVSASRADMFASEVGQAPPLAGAEVPLIMSGMEREFGKCTDRVTMPANAIVFKVVNLYYPAGTAVSGSGRTAIIYQDMDAATLHGGVPTYGIVIMQGHSQNHHMLGFDFVRTPISRSIQSGMSIRKGSLLAHSPSITPSGDYKPGINANVLLASLPEARQDGVVMRRGFAERCKFKGYAEMSVSFGEDEIPLNLYGDSDTYKIHPDVGETIRPDGILFATRKLIPGLYPTQTSRKNLRRFANTDSPKRVKEPGARVIDVEVFHAPRGRPTTPEQMIKQPMSYLAAQTRYYQELLEAQRAIQQAHGNNHVLTPAFHNELVRAIARCNHSGGRSNVTFVEAGAPLSEYTIKIKYSYDLTPIEGHKLAGRNGDKGVLVDVWDDEDMPYDEQGNVADIITSGAEVVGRLIPSRPYEIDINASFRETRRKIIASISADPSPENYIRNFDWLVGAYQIVSPRFAELVKTRDPKKHIDHVIKDEIHLWVPTDNPVSMLDAIPELLEKYPKHKGKISMKMPDGSRQWSTSDGTIGKQYIMILEKTGDEYGAVASPTLQAQGAPSRLTKSDRQAAAGRPQATRFGETEGRIINAFTQPGALSMLLDIANSTTTHRAACRTILTHPTPTNIDRIVDRSQYPRGNNRIVRIGNNSLFAAGFEFNYREVED